MQLELGGGEADAAASECVGNGEAQLGGDAQHRGDGIVHPDDGA